MEYQIFSGHTPAELSNNVNEALREGWRTAGGVTTLVVRADRDGDLDPKGDLILYYYQALIKGQ
jgi:hypothetical protein